ncbi:MAG: hypothetical protein AAB521_03990 [Patescibacteria group bacterium]
MEPKPEPQEPQQSQEIKDTPEHLFAKDQLAGIKFLNPKTNERTSLQDRLGKLFPRYEAIVLSQFDLLRATEGPQAQYKEDAKRRAEQIYRDWKTEQRKEAESSQEWNQIGSGSYEGEKWVLQSDRLEDDYSDTSHP